MRDNVAQLVLVIGLSLAVSLLLGALLTMSMFWFMKLKIEPRQATLQAWMDFAKLSGLKTSVGWPPLLSGVYRSRPIRVAGRFSDSLVTAYTRVTIETDFRGRVYLEATRRRIGTGHTGDATLDQLYTLRSQPADLAARVLTDPAVRPLLIQVQPVRLFINHNSVTCQLEHLETETAGLQQLADLTWETAEVVQRLIGDIIPVEDIP
jgi:hypothetical protein